MRLKFTKSFPKKHPIADCSTSWVDPTLFPRSDIASLIFIVFLIKLLNSLSLKFFSSVVISF